MKMYAYLKMFYWSSMKKDEGKYVASCIVCHKEKVKQHKPSG